MKDKLAFVALLALSLVLIIGGVEGNMGKLLACLLVPSQIVDDSTF